MPISTRAASLEAIEARGRSGQPHRVSAKLVALAKVASANVVLASLPRSLREEIVAHATCLELKRGDIVEHELSGKRVFFPLSGMLTAVRTRNDGSHFAYLHRGREAAVNAIGFDPLQITVGASNLVADVPGKVLALEMQYYRTLLEDSPALMHAMLLHASHVIISTEQSTDCAGHHPVRARTAYFLLLLRVHQSTDMLDVTHSRIGEVLGVRRQSISEALSTLKNRRVITLDRGRINVADRRELWQQACDCRCNVDRVEQLQIAGEFAYTG